MTRLDPGTDRPGYSAPIQPIRNGEAANLALHLLGLGPVPGSTINQSQDLALTIPAPADFRLDVIGTNCVLSFTTLPNVFYDLQRTDVSISPKWSTVVSNLPGTGTLITLTDWSPMTNANRFYRLRLHF